MLTWFYWFRWKKTTCIGQRGSVKGSFFFFFFPAEQRSGQWNSKKNVSTWAKNVPQPGFQLSLSNNGTVTSIPSRCWCALEAGLPPLTSRYLHIIAPKDPQPYLRSFVFLPPSLSARAFRSRPNTSMTESGGRKPWDSHVLMNISHTRKKKKEKTHEYCHAI